MKIYTALKGAALLFVALICFSGVFAQSVRINPIGTYATGVYNQGAAEIAAYDERSKRLFIVNGASSRIDVLSLANPSAPTLLFSIDVTPYGRQANSVAVYNGVIAAAVEANVKTDNGRVVFFNADGRFLNAVTVGALPDMLTFTPDGTRVLVANEGEPNDAYTVDPEGSVSIVDITSGIGAARVSTADFRSFNRAGVDRRVRIFGPNATVAQDLEPEYIAVAADSRTAWVTLQENNAVGVLDLRENRFTRIVPLGYKNHNLPGNGLDASDRDNANLIRNWEV
jgi:DNA-binding beta-propeller fold protein YncE